MSNISASVIDLNQLNKPVNGKGGFQNLLRRLQDGYNHHTDKVDMSKPDHDRVIKAIDKYGSGGWQDRLLKLFFE